MLRPAELALAVPLGLLVACRTPAPREGLRDALRSAIAAHSGATIGFAYAELDGGAACEIDATTVFHAASTMKIAVMIEAFRRADAQDLDLDAPLLVRNEFASIVDSSAYSLEPGDDSDPGLFEAVGSTIPARELIARMIRRSSNLATNLLIERLAPARVQATIEALGAVHGMKVLRGVEDGLAFRAGLNNVVTAKDLLVLLRAIGTGHAASPSSCRAMLEILAGQEFRDMIPAGLPPGTVIAHKTGSITKVAHDAGIVDPFGVRPWVIVVLTRGFPDEAAAAKAGAELVRVVHAAR